MIFGRDQMAEFGFGFRKFLEGLLDTSRWGGVFCSIGTWGCGKDALIELLVWPRVNPPPHLVRYILREALVIRYIFSIFPTSKTRRLTMDQCFGKNRCLV